MSADTIDIFNDSELLTLRHCNPARYRVATAAYTALLQSRGNLSENAVVDSTYLMRELSFGSICAIGVTRHDPTQAAGFLSAKIKRVGPHLSLHVQPPWFTEVLYDWGVSQTVLYEKLRNRCLQYILLHRCVYRLSDEPVPHRIFWHVLGTKYTEQYLFRGAKLVRV